VSGEAPRLKSPVALGLLLLAVLPYLNGLPDDFTYDDKLIIRDDDRIASPANVGEIFTTQYFGGSLRSAQNYRPVVLLTYAVERWVHGNRAWAFRSVNIQLHAGVTLLLFAWLLDLGFRRGPSLSVACLFAVATIHVEAVTSLVGRAEVLAALLVLASARLWLRATSGESLRFGAYGGCLAAFLAAVFVKESAVVLPGLVALGELFREGRGASPAEAWRRNRPFVRRAFAGLFLPVILLFLVRLLVIRGFLISREAGIWDLENPLVALTWAVRVADACGLLLRYVAKTFVPVHLSADHSAYALRLASTLSDPRAWGGALGLVLCGALAAALWTRRPLAAFGAAFFFGTLLPAANLLFPIGTVWAERLAYLPSAGLFAVAVGLFSPPRREVPRPPAWPWREALLVGALAASGPATAMRNRAWKDDATLYADMVQKVPNSAKAHYNVAYDANLRGDRTTAEAQLLRAVEIFPRHYDAWGLLGRIAWDEKRWNDAIADYRKSVEAYPEYENGRWGLAKVLDEAGRTAEAEKAYRDGLKALPDSYPLLYHWAGFLEKEGRLSEAEEAWSEAAEAAETEAPARLARAKVLVRLGRPEDEQEAWEEARWALDGDPSFVPARLFLAERYEKAGKILAAAGELSRAFRTKPADEAVAAALLEFASRHSEARGRARLALKAIRAAVPRPGERLRIALAGSLP